MNEDREYPEPQFRDQVEQFEHEEAQRDYQERLAAMPAYKRPGYRHEMDEDELMELERERDCD